jgi:hypothetical protein
LNKIDLLITAKKKREIEDSHHGKDLPESDSRKPCAVDLAYPDFSEHIEFIAGNTSGVNPEPHLPLALFTDHFIEFPHVIYPGGAFGGHRGKLDEKLFGGCAIRAWCGENVMEKQTEEKHENEREPFHHGIVLLMQVFAGNPVRISNSEIKSSDRKSEFEKREKPFTLFSFRAFVID